MNEAKLDCHQRLSDAYCMVWYDLSTILNIKEENVDLRSWIRDYKDFIHDLAMKHLKIAGEALKEDN